MRIFRLISRAVLAVVLMCGLSVSTFAGGAQTPLQVDTSGSVRNITVNIGGALVAIGQYTVSTGLFQPLINGVPGSTFLTGVFQQADTGALTTTVSAKLIATIDVMPDFCLISNVTGSIPNSTCVQAAVNAACARNNPAILNFPAAWYVLHDITQHCGAPVIGHPGTRFDFSGSSSAGWTVSPTSWPAVTHQNWIYRFKISDVEFYQTSGTNVGLNVYGFNDCQIERLHFTGTGHDMIHLYGGYKCSVDHVSGNYYKNIGSSYDGYGLYIKGDMSGKSRSGGTCTLGDCSARVDLVSIHNFDMLGTTTGSGVYLEGTVNTTMGEHISIENKAIGLDVRCPTGFPDITYCPQFFTFTDFQSEGATNEPFYLQDFSDFQCTACYAIGNGSGANHAVDAGFTNYSNTLGTGGGIRLIGGRYGNVGSSVISVVHIRDLSIDGAVLVDGNLANIGAYGVQVNGIVQAHILNSSLCQYLAAVGSPTMGAINFNSSTGDTWALGNSFRGCSSGITGSGSGVNQSAYNTGP